MHTHQIILTEVIRSFMLAGKAIFTLKSVKTGQRFTFKVKKAKGDRPGLYWVSTGINGQSFSFMGALKPEGYNVARVYQGDVKASQAFAWFISHLKEDFLPEVIEFWHEGRCGRCARLLTVPESIAAGIGPECIKVQHSHRSI